MSTNIDTRAAFCDKCHAAIRQYDTDGGLWLTDCSGGGYDCGAGGLHVAPSLMFSLSVHADGDMQDIADALKQARRSIMSGHPHGVVPAAGLRNDVTVSREVVGEWQFVSVSA